jgi:hypothetical protein
MLRRVALVRSDVSVEPNAAVTRGTRIGVLGTTLAATCHPDEGGRRFLRNVGSYKSNTA